MMSLGGKRRPVLGGGLGGGLYALGPSIFSAPSALQMALAKFGFFAPLTQDVFLDRGYGAASFTRATTATVKDWEGAIRNCVSGEVRFAGQRRVRNMVTASEGANTVAVAGTTPPTASLVTKDGYDNVNAVVFPSGVGAGGAADSGANFYSATPTNGRATLASGKTYNARILVALSRALTGSERLKVYIDGGVALGTVYEMTAASQVGSTLTWIAPSAALVSPGDGGTSFYVAPTTANLTAPLTVYLARPQIELVTGASNQNPSEYVSVGAAKLNELLYTEEFDNAWWNKSNVTATAGQADPLGGASAELLQVTLTGLDRQMYRTAPTTAKGTLTHSIYAKAGTTNWVSLSPFDGGTRQAVWFDLANGVVGTTHASVTATITGVGNGWYRLTATSTVVSAPGYCSIEVVDGDGSATGTAGANAYFFGFQIEGASSAGAYFPVGSVYPYHGACVDGVKYFDTLNGNTVASNVVTEATGPAITRSSINEYGYLAESARTNLCLQSSNFGTTWAAIGTPTRSAAAAYCGEIALDLIGDDDAGALEGYSQTITFTADAVKSISFIIKEGTSTSTAVALVDTTAVANRVLGVVTWSAGVPTYTPTTGTNERAAEALANGCYRIFVASSSVTAANTNSLRFYPATDAALATTATGTVYIGGVQAENATTASVSHIPTTTATVTRNADAVTWPSAGNVASAGGTIFAEALPQVNLGGSTQDIASLSDTTANEYVTPYYNGTNVLLSVLDGGASQASMTAGAGTLGAVHKIASRWGANDFAVSMNGAAVVADTSGTIPTVTTIYAGALNSNFQLNGTIRNIRIAQVALTDAELQLITQ